MTEKQNARRIEIIKALIKDGLSDGKTFQEYLEEFGTGPPSKMRLAHEEVYKIMIDEAEAKRPALTINQALIQPIIFPDKLRDYQQQSVSECLSEFREKGKDRCYIQLPTGAGKTRVMYQLINEDFAEFWASTAPTDSRMPSGQPAITNLGAVYVCLSPRKDLAEQHFRNPSSKNHKTPKGVTINADVIIIHCDVPKKDILAKITAWKQTRSARPLIISSLYQSVERLKSILEATGITQIRKLFADEAHLIARWGQQSELARYGWKCWMMRNTICQRRIFMSATPTENQVGNLDEIWGTLINPVSVGRLIARKILVPIETLIPNIIFNADEDDNSPANLFGICEPLFKTFTTSGSKKGVVFCNTQAKCSALHKMFRDITAQSGARLKSFLYIGKGFEDGKLESLDDENMDITLLADEDDYKSRGEIAEFEACNHEPVVIFVCRKISMGYDHTPIDFVAFADPKCSKAELAQCVGRGLRTSPDTGKTICRVFIPITPSDYSANTAVKRKHATLFEYLKYLNEDVGVEYRITDRADIHKSPKPLFVNQVNPLATPDSIQPAVWDEEELGLSAPVADEPSTTIDGEPLVRFLDEHRLFIILSNECVSGSSFEKMRYKYFLRMMREKVIYSPELYCRFIAVVPEMEQKFVKWPKTVEDIYSTWPAFKWIEVSPAEIRAKYYPDLATCAARIKVVDTELMLNNMNYDFWNATTKYKKIREIDPKIPEIHYTKYYN